jgi:hypothetical protein
LDFDDVGGEQTVSFLMRLNDIGGVFGLGEAHYDAFFFIYPVVDEVDAIFALYGEIFYMGSGDVFGGYLTGAEFVNVEIEVLAFFHVGFGAIGHEFDMIRDEAMGFSMGFGDIGGICGGREAVYVSPAFVDPEFDEFDTIFVFDGEVFFMGIHDGGIGHFSRSQVVDVDVHFSGCLCVKIAGKEGGGGK